MERPVGIFTTDDGISCEVSMTPDGAFMKIPIRELHTGKASILNLIKGHFARDMHSLVLASDPDPVRRAIFIDDCEYIAHLADKNQLDKLSPQHMEFALQCNSIHAAEALAAYGCPTTENIRHAILQKEWHIVYELL